MDRGYSSDGLNRGANVLKKRRKTMSYWLKKLKPESVDEALTKTQQRALATAKAQPKDKVSLPKAPWDKKKEGMDYNPAKGEYNQPKGKEVGKKVGTREAIDPVDKKELKGKHADRDDKDIDNDGDTDSSDKYLHLRRKAISKKVDENPVVGAMVRSAARAAAGSMAKSAMKKEEVEAVDEAATRQMPGKMPARRNGKTGAPKMTGDSIKIQRVKDKAHADAMGRHVKSGRKKSLKAMYMEDDKKREECTLCMGKGCEHCDNTGYHEVAKTEAFEKIPRAKHDTVKDPMGKGLSPSAKKELERETGNPEPLDEPKVDAQNFKNFRKGLKAAPKRRGDNPSGDKAPVK